MGQFNKIMVAVDFSTNSKAAAQHAFDLARELEAAVIFIYVIDRKDINLIQQAVEKILAEKKVQFSMEGFIDDLKDEKLNKLDEMVESIIPTGIEYQAQIYTGIPYQEMLKAIKEYEADLFVMGVKGKSDLKDVTTGSTALKMFKRCPIPLVTVRDYQK